MRAPTEAPSFALSSDQAAPAPELTALLALEGAPWQALSYARIMEHFMASRNWERMEDYLRQAEDLLPDEKVILFFLHTVYSGSLATMQLYARYVTGFLNHVGKPFQEVTHLDADAYLRFFALNGAKPATVNTIAAALKSFYRRLCDARIMAHNPTTFLKKKRETRAATLPGHLSHSLGEAELDVLFEGLDRCGAHPRDKALFVLLFMTGLRAEEMVRLTWGNLVEWQGQWYLDVMGKGAKARRVYVPVPALRALMRYREQVHGVAPLRPAPAIVEMPLLGHVRRAGKHLTRHGVYWLVKKWCTVLLAKNAVSPHWFRHTCFTQLAHKGVSLEAIKALAGHESLETTMRYNEAAALMEPAGKVFERR